MQFATIVPPASLPAAPTWSANLGGAPSYALIAGARVYVAAYLATGVSEIFALNASDGTIAWGPKAIAGATAAAYDGGKLFVVNQSSAGATLTAYDATAGTSLWSAAVSNVGAFTGETTASNGVVFVSGANDGGQLLAFDEVGGNLLWSGFSGSGGTAAITVDGVYSSFPCETIDYRPLTGEIVWRNQTGCSGGGGATGVVANGLYYSPNGFATYSGQTFNAETGAGPGSYAASVIPAIGAQNGYFLQSGALNAIANGSSSPLWTFTGDGTLVTAPILVNGYVFIGGSSGNLYMLDALTGTVLKTVAMGAAIPAGASDFSSLPVSGLTAGGGLLLVPAGNTLGAFTLSTSP